MILSWHWGEEVSSLRALLERGGILAIPTESSYGLGVDPESIRGVEAIYRLKDRERGKPLPVVVGNLDRAGRLGVDLQDPGLERVAPLWPAPLTVVVPLLPPGTLGAPAVPLPAAAGSGRLALRIPAHDRLRRLLLELDLALTATSANRSGKPPLIEPEAVCELLEGSDAMLFDDGPMPGGEPSTVVSWSDGSLEVLRAGRYPIRRLQESEDPSSFSANDVEITVDNSRE